MTTTTSPDRAAEMRKKKALRTTLRVVHILLSIPIGVMALAPDEVVGDLRDNWVGIALLVLLSASGFAMWWQAQSYRSR